MRDQRGAEIHLFSDGAVPDLSEFENKALPLIYHKVGKESNNLGITALDARANPENGRQRAIYANVANFSSNSLSTDLELLFDERLLETRPLTMPAGRNLAPGVPGRPNARWRFHRAPHRQGRSGRG